MYFYISDNQILTYKEELVVKLKGVKFIGQADTREDAKILFKTYYDKNYLSNIDSIRDVLNCNFPNPERKLISQHKYLDVYKEDDEYAIVDSLYNITYYWCMNQDEAEDLIKEIESGINELAKLSYESVKSKVKYFIRKYKDIEYCTAKENCARDIIVNYLSEELHDVVESRYKNNKQKEGT